jgi:predicted Rossmann fold nucleotide-binding protein DprA/Smf involved in DNA uptake
LAVARRKGIIFVALDEPAYPVRLRMIDDPPPLIAWVLLELELAGRPAGGLRWWKHTAIDDCST